VPVHVCVRAHVQSCAGEFMNEGAYARACMCARACAVLCQCMCMYVFI